MCIFKRFKKTKKKKALNFSVNFWELCTKLLAFAERAAVCHGWLSREAEKLSLPGTRLIH